MKLPRSERADLARELIASLDEEVEAGGEDVEAAWLAEVERRMEATDRGTEKLEPWEVVHDRIAARLRDMRR
jgi:putative addiction module component (TIGR02574 family)